MNFSKTIKKEILSKPIKDRCCKKAFLAGFLRGNASLFSQGDEFGVQFFTDTEETAMILSSYIKLLFDYDIREVSVEEDKLNKKDKFTLTVTGEKAEQILRELEIIKDSGEDLVVNLQFGKEIIAKECCLHSFIRGMFVANGTCSIPSDNGGNGYHLEMSFSHSVPASEIMGILLKNGIRARIIRRKSHYVVYIKSAEEIKNFCAFLSASVSVCKLTDLIINREIVNDSTRRMNCDLGNVNRQIDASIKQVQAINKIIGAGEFNNLKADLKETANARLENQEMNLTELSKMLGITKSCLNHRLRKIIEISNEIQG